MYTRLVSPSVVAERLDHPEWVFFDCSFSLADPDRMEREYRRRHIPGALYALMDRDLSGTEIPGKTGRHPLPEIRDCVNRFSARGIREETQVVVYDDAGGAFASRLWWFFLVCSYQCSD